MSKKPNSTPTKNSAGRPLTILFIAVIYNIIFSPALQNWFLIADYELKFAVHEYKTFTVDLQM